MNLTPHSTMVFNPLVQTPHKVTSFTTNLFYWSWEITV